MAYEAQTWVDGVDGGTPITADALNHIEAGVEDAAEKADGAAPASHSHAAGDVTSGTFSVARIPTLSTSKITGLDDALASITARLEALETSGE